MNSEGLILDSEQVLLIKKTNIVRPYRDDAKEGFAGKKYRLYSYDSKAFAVHEDDDFHKDFEDGQIGKVMLTVTDEGYSLANHVTWKRMNNQRKNKVIYDSFTAENYIAGKLTSIEELEKLAV